MVDAIKYVLEESIQNLLTNDNYRKYQHLICKSIEKSTKKDAAEYKISLATKLFWAIFKHDNQQRNEKHDGVALVKKKSAKNNEAYVSITSNLGLERPFVTQSRLNELIFHNLPVHKLHATFSFVGIGHQHNSLTIHFTTLDHNKRQHMNGMLMCSRCGKFVKASNSGLEWHIKNVHKIKDHSKAYNAVTSAKHSLIQFDHPLNNYYLGGGNEGNCSTTNLRKQHDMATAQKNPENLKKMIQSGKDKPLSNLGLEACRSGNLHVLQELVLSKKFHPKESYDRNGSNGLLWASGGGHLNCVVYLIEQCGIDPNIEKQKGRRGYAGRTALHWSCRNGHLNVVQYLLSSMQIDVETDDGTTPFHLAVWQNQINVCKYLVEKGCNVNHINSYGCNAVLWAGQGLNTGYEIFELLHSLNCNFHIFNENGQGILHKAAQRGNTHICKLLLVGHRTSEKDGFRHDDCHNILKMYKNGLLYSSYQYAKTFIGNEICDDGNDVDLNFICNILIDKHYQLTTSEQSRPYELAKYSNNIPLSKWLLNVYNDLLSINTKTKITT